MLSTYDVIISGVFNLLFVIFFADLPASELPIQISFVMMDKEINMRAVASTNYFPWMTAATIAEVPLIPGGRIIKADAGSFMIILMD